MEKTIKFQNKSVILKMWPGIFEDIPSFLDYDAKKVIITDDKIPTQYVDYLKEQLDAEVFIFKSGEKSKNYKTVIKIISFLESLNITKSDLLIALGGGVCIDITGFVASIYKRGIRYISIPTSSLAMIDSCVGGKTGINFDNVKNMVGSIYHPDYIFVDPNLLKTLPKRHLNNGLVEALKMGITINEDLYEEFLKDNLNLNRIIALSIIHKSIIVEQDENDQGIRQILNFGHTLGHCIESDTSFKLLHGEAVANGMLLEIKDEKLRKQVIEILKKIKVPLVDVNINSLVNYLYNDKKINANHITLCDISEIGKAKLVKVKIEKLKEWFNV